MFHMLKDIKENMNIMREIGNIEKNQLQFLEKTNALFIK